MAGNSGERREEIFSAYPRALPGPFRSDTTTTAVVVYRPSDRDGSSVTERRAGTTCSVGLGNVGTRREVYPRISPKGGTRSATASVILSANRSFRTSHATRVSSSLSVRESAVRFRTAVSSNYKSVRYNGTIDCLSRFHFLVKKMPFAVSLFRVTYTIKIVRVRRERHHRPRDDEPSYVHNSNR